jgi:hypothetical protein
MTTEFLACESPRDRLRFERFPERLHAGEPIFTPPFPGSIAKILAPDSAFHKRHGKIFPFLALRNGVPVGRIAAIINHSHNSYHKDQTGFFGFFDCEDNMETARALFEKAGSVLQGLGMTALRGPYNPSINDECGLLVWGFHQPTCVGLTWNPAYYEHLVLQNGFDRKMSSYGFDLPLHRLEGPSRLKPLAERFAKRTKARLRAMDMKNLARDLDIVQEVYNATLERNWGFVPIAKEDMDSAAEEFRAIAYPPMMMIVEQDGVNAGVALTIPNINEHLRAIRKTPWILRLLHFLYLLKTRRPQSGRQVVYGIASRFRNNGLHAWLTYHHFMEAKAHLHQAELGWIQETNTEVLELSELIGGEKIHKWDIYERPIPFPTS